MKKICLTLSLVIIATLGFAQLQVHSNNNVSIGSSATPAENLYVEGATQLRCAPAIKGLFFLNYNNNVGGGGPFNEPLIRCTFGNTAWLGNASAPFWRVYSNEVHSVNFVNISSDKRLKSNIRPLETALTKLNLLEPVRYDMNSPVEDVLSDAKKEAIRKGGENQIGLLAQDVAKIFPEAVSYDEEADLYSIKYGMLIPVLIKAIQEQQKQIEELTNTKN